MEEKQQHRQHFNLSEGAKQMLEELTARRYPGKQRRQSQMVEDLIIEAFNREPSCYNSASGLDDTLLLAGGLHFSPNVEDTSITHYALVPSTRREIAEDQTHYRLMPSSELAHLCQACQRAIQPGWKHCVYCGQALTRLCPKCATLRIAADNAHFCSECGQPFVS